LHSTLQSIAVVGIAFVPLAVVPVSLRDGAGEDVQRSAPETHEAEQLRCGSDRVCISEAEGRRFEARHAAGIRSADILATLASSSRDPLVDAAAVRACEPMGIVATRVQVRQLISVEQWARLDPGNTVSWLQVSSTAATRKSRTLRA